MSLAWFWQESRSPPPPLPRQRCKSATFTTWRVVRAEKKKFRRVGKSSGVSGGSLAPFCEDNFRAPLCFLPAAKSVGQEMTNFAPSWLFWKNYTTMTWETHCSLIVVSTIVFNVMEGLWKSCVYCSHCRTQEHTTFSNPFWDIRRECHRRRSIRCVSVLFQMLFWGSDWKTEKVRKLHKGRKEEGNMRSKNSFLPRRRGIRMRPSRFSPRPQTFENWGRFSSVRRW